jgi:SAM-dependent methyltransferase
VQRLSHKSYWEQLHTAGARPAAQPASRLRAFLRRLAGPRLIAWSRNYTDYVATDIIYRKFLPPKDGLSLIEVGCAPGDFLAALARQYRYEAFGVEYTEHGVAATRSVFERSGFDPAHVYQGDVLDPPFLDRHEHTYDVVLSRGFLEHFHDPRAIASVHLRLLKPGGLLVLSVPNLRGLNHALTRFFHADVLRIHNLDVMTRSALSALFPPESVEPLFCGYYGIFDFGLFNTAGGSWRRHVLAAARALQRGLNVIFRVLAPRGGATCRWTSPHLLFIGRKRP